MLQILSPRATDMESKKVLRSVLPKISAVIGRVKRKQGNPLLLAACRFRERGFV